MNIKRALRHPGPYVKIASERFRNFLRSHLYKGKAVHCQICEWKGKKFFNGKCPKCGSLARTRLIPFALEHFKLVRPEIKILHIAPNLNEYDFIRRTINDSVAYDRLNIRSVPHINIVQDITNTDLKSESYDLAMAWHVLEHIKEDRKAIAEVKRLLKPGGHFLVSVPIFPLESPATFEDDSIPYEKYEEMHGHYDHCRSCGLDYYQRFEDAGYSTRTLMIKDIGEQIKSKYGLFEHHVVWCFDT
ncbi:MAG: methyltransferase domain-containing protein [Bacteroidia bacterium]|nr:methyltransferase domain-containing protein [Bacteroidia bacterium]NND52326.1 methyltransferase domain-containing protein [Flavobacteriaceae bacterium]